jgi:hypothetical protein
MYVSFFLIYYTTMLSSYILLPEGLIRGKHPIINMIDFSNNLFVLTMQIFGYNLIPSFLIIGSNLIAQQSRIVKERFVPVGYIAFWGLTVLFGILVGTWSFDLATEPPPLASRIFRVFDIVHHSGLLEFSSYLLLAVTSFRFTLWYSDRKMIVHCRSWSEIEVPRSEKVVFVLGFAALFLGAVVESRGILQGYK